jgi:hypothetical protein
MDWNGRIIVLGPPDVLNPDSIVISDLFEKHPIPDSTKQSGFVSSLQRLHSIFQASPRLGQFGLAAKENWTRGCNNQFVFIDV